MKRKLGQGRALRSSLADTKTPVRSFIYRAFAHKMRVFSCESTSCSSFSPCNSSRLAAAFSSLRLPSNPQISTHSFPYICSYRDSTHFHTVHPPTLLGVQGATSGRVPVCSGLNTGATRAGPCAGTVLSPTFSPFFQSFCYRPSNHSPTAPLPTETAATTALSPTKLSLNRLNLHRSLSGKDVFKICIKNTSGLMSLFFILVFFSSRWRLSQS